MGFWGSFTQYCSPHLIGMIPEELAALEQLDILDLAANRLQGKCSDLQQLGLELELVHIVMAVASWSEGGSLTL